MPYFAFFHKRVWRTSGKKFKKIKNFEWENCQIFADFIWNDSAVLKNYCQSDRYVCILTYHCNDCVCVRVNSEPKLARMTSRMKSNMGENIEEVLRNTLRVLCSNAISYGSQISIDAMVGITINNSEVILVNVHEQLVLLDKSAVTQASSGGGDSVFGQGSVKSRLFGGTATAGQHHQQSDNLNTTAVDSSMCTVSGHVANEKANEMAGLGSGARHFYDDVVDVLEAVGGGNELDMSVEEGEYPDDNAAEYHDEFLNDFDTAGTDVADGGLDSEDVKPFSMVASSSGADSIQMGKAVALSSPCGCGKPDAAQMSGGHKKPSAPRTKHREKAETMHPSPATKAFQCTICDGQLNRRSSWLRHLLVRHKQNPDGSAADPARIQRYVEYGQNRKVDKDRRAMQRAQAASVAKLSNQRHPSKGKKKK